MAVTGLDKVFVVNAETNTKYGGVDPTGEFVTVNELVPQPYKVYTALLTQSGGDDTEYIGSGELIIGTTYRITNPWPDSDFTNVGAPNNNQETFFVATGTTPNNWGTPGSDDVLEYNTGAPVVTVLENTIGNIWFTYNSAGIYNLNSDGLFSTTEKCYLSALPFYNNNADGIAIPVLSYGDSSLIQLVSRIADTPVDYLYNTSIEIRVYN